MYRDITATPIEESVHTPSAVDKSLAVDNFQLLFGRANDQSKALRASELPATSLDLTLRGSLAGGEPASAIIKGSDGQDHLYLVGEAIAGGAILESVHPQYIVIKYRGHLQKLPFPELYNQEIQSFSTPLSSTHSNSLPDGPIAEAKELERHMDQMRQRMYRPDDSGQGN